MTDTAALNNDAGRVQILTAAVAGFILFLLGVAWTRMKSANGAYKSIKKGVKPARKLFWLSIGGVVKIGFWVVVLLSFLVLWQVRAVDSATDRAPAVPAVIEPSGR